MTITLNVGFSQKLGQPDYGSLGASCHIECELDGRLPGDDPEAFQTKVRDLYAACATAVREELARSSGTPIEAQPAPQNGSSTSPRKPTSAKATPGNGGVQQRASQKQLDYLQQLSRQIACLGPHHLEALAQRVCDKPLAELSSFDASSLIDTLKAIKEGKLDLAQILDGMS